MFNIGDKVTIDMDRERYKECRCFSCKIINNGGYGIVIEYTPNPHYVDTVKLHVFDTHGNETDGYNYYIDGIKLLEAKEHDWEV